MKFGFRVGADVESGSHVRRLIHSWTTWNDGRNESKKILEKIFGETNEGGEKSIDNIGGIDDYVENVNLTDAVEDYYEITDTVHHEEDQVPRKRKKRKVFKIIDEYQRVQILNYVRGNLEALFPDERTNGRPKTANILAWDEVYQLCMRYIYFFLLLHE